MTGDDVTLEVLASEVRALAATLAGAEQNRIEGQAAMRAWQSVVDSRLASIETHARHTNGLVAALEADRIAREAVEKARPAIEAAAVAAATPTIAHDVESQTKTRAWKVTAAVLGVVCSVAMVTLGVVARLAGA